jgi:hypothetical protein
MPPFLAAADWRIVRQSQQDKQGNEDSVQHFKSFTGQSPVFASLLDTGG